MATIAHDWRAAVSDTDGQDTPMLVYCDWLEENGGEELAAILRKWMEVRTSIRTSSESQDAFDTMIRDYNQYHDFPDVQEVEPRKAWMTGRIGGCYTHLHISPDYLRRRPNLLSDQPFRSMTLLANRVEQEDLDDVLTNWRMVKLWHLDISYFAYWGHNEQKLIQSIRQMKPLHYLDTLRIRGVRNLDFKISSTLIGLKKVPKGCKIYLGNLKEIVA